MTINIRIAQSLDEKKRVFNFRYCVCPPKYVPHHCVIDHEMGLIFDKWDENASIFYAEKNDQIVGCIRLSHNKSQELCSFHEKKYLCLTLEKQLGIGKISITDMLIIDPRMRGQTLASLLLSTAYQFDLQQNTVVNLIETSLDLKKHYERLGYRQYKKTKKNDTKCLMLNCLYDYQHLLRSMSPFAMALHYNQDDLGSTASVIAEIFPKFKRNTNVIPCDIGTFWALFADTFSRHFCSRPGLFDGRNMTEVNTVLSHATTIDVSAGQKVPLPKDAKKTFGVVLQGSIGEGISSGFGHHWFDVVKESDTFISFHQSINYIAELIALEDCKIALLPQNLIKVLKQKDPMLATRISMNMIAIIQYHISEIEDDTRVHLHDEEISVQFIGL